MSRVRDLNIMNFTSQRTPVDCRSAARFFATNCCWVCSSFLVPWFEESSMVYPPSIGRYGEHATLQQREFHVKHWSEGASSSYGSEFLTFNYPSPNAIP
jgi:hypothetical protein